MLLMSLTQVVLGTTIKRSALLNNELKFMSSGKPVVAVYSYNISASPYTLSPQAGKE